MPTLTRWFIRTSFAYFFLGLVAGILTALQPLLKSTGWLAAPLVAALFPVYIHLLVFGWTTQLIFGVVFWMFPKYSREKPRGSEALGWTTFWLLNVGLLLRVIGEPIYSQGTPPISQWMLLLSAILQWLSGIVFVVNTWGRVKEK
jgi:cbb3-type cytochrome oxidase subunit 1